MNYARSTAYNLTQRITRLEREEADYAAKVERLAAVGGVSRADKFRMTLATKKLRQIRRDLAKVRSLRPFNAPSSRADDPAENKAASST